MASHGTQVWPEDQPNLCDWRVLGDGMASVLNRALQVANTAATSRATTGGSSQTTTIAGTPEPNPIDQRTLELGRAQAKGFIAMVASKAAISGSPTVGSNINWRSAARGIDQLLSGSHEFASRQTAGPDAHFERSAYINGTQHVLGGLPRELSAAEAAMLHRAMPRAVAHAADTGPAWWQRRPPDGQQQEGEGEGVGAGAGGRRRNVVHSLVLLYLYWLSVFAVWFALASLKVGRKMVEAERQHAYLQRLLLGEYRLACIVVQKLREWSDFWPCRIPLEMLKYVGIGVLGAFLEVWERRVMGEEGTGGNTAPVQEVQPDGPLVPLGGDILSVTSQ